MRLNITLTLIVFSMLISSIALGATPGNDFLNVNVYAVIPGNGLHEGGNATLKEFVENGLNKGVWKKSDSNQWIYTIKDNVNRKNEILLSFIKIKGANSQPTKIILNRIVSGGKDSSQLQLYNFFNKIYFNLPSVKKAHINQENIGKIEKQNENNKKIFNAKSQLNGNYSTSNPVKTLSITNIDDVSVYFHIKTKTCDISTDAKYNIDAVEYGGGINLKAVHQEDDCDIQIEANTYFDIFDVINVKYRGKCDKYCTKIKTEYGTGYDDFINEGESLSGSYCKEKIKSVNTEKEWK